MAITTAKSPAWVRRDESICSSVNKRPEISGSGREANMMPIYQEFVRITQKIYAFWLQK